MSRGKEGAALAFLLPKDVIVGLVLPSMVTGQKIGPEERCRAFLVRGWAPSTAKQVKVVGHEHINRQAYPKTKSGVKGDWFPIGVTLRIQPPSLAVLDGERPEHPRGTAIPLGSKARKPATVTGGGLSHGVRMEYEFFGARIFPGEG